MVAEKNLFILEEEREEKAGRYMGSPLT